MAFRVSDNYSCPKGGTDHSGQISSSFAKKREQHPTWFLRRKRQGLLFLLSLIIICLLIAPFSVAFGATDTFSAQVLSTDVFFEEQTGGTDQLRRALLRFRIDFAYSIYAACERTIDDVSFEIDVEAFSPAENIWHDVEPGWNIYKNEKGFDGFTGQISIEPNVDGEWSLLITEGYFEFTPGNHVPEGADWYMLALDVGDFMDPYDDLWFSPTKLRLRFRFSGHVYYEDCVDDYVSVDEEWDVVEIPLDLPPPGTTTGMQRIYHGGPRERSSTYFDQLLDCAPCVGLGMPVLSVNSSTRNLVIQDRDFAYGSLGPSVYLTRTYNEGSDIIGLFGKGWTSNLERSVEEQDNLSVHVVGQSGGLNIYTHNADASYTPPFGVFDRLEKNQDGSWDLTGRTSRIVNHFDSTGRFVSTTDRNANTVTYSYTGDNLTNITDAASRQTTLAYDTSGRVTSVTDPLGNSAGFQYDANGNLIIYTDMAGTVVTYAYDTDSHMISMTTPKGQWIIIGEVDTDDTYKVVSITDPAGNTREYETTGGGSDKITDQDGRSFTYESGRNMETTAIVTPTNARTEFEYNSEGKLTRLTDPENRSVQIEYDTRDNPVRFIDAAGEQVTIEYNNEDYAIRMTDPFGYETRFEYGTSNNLTKIIDSLGQNTEIPRNAQGLPSKLINPRGQATSFSYSQQGTLTGIADPNGNSVGLGYNAIGRVTSRTDAKGATVSREYDELGRITKLHYPDGTVEYEYDCCLLKTATAKDGRKITLESNNLNRLVRYTDLNGFVMRIEYDKSGKVTSLVYPGEKTVQYEYDASGRLNAVTDWLDNRATYSYDQSGLLIEENLPNGTKTQYEYTTSGHLRVFRNVGVSGTPLPQFTYERDKAGRILSVSTENYEQMIPSFGAESYSYGIDDSLTSAGGNTYEYDKNGSLVLETTPSGSLTYTYDYNDRLAQLVTPTQTYVYEYDPMGFRVSRQVDRDKTLYAGLGSVLMRTDALKQAKDFFVYGFGLAWRIDAVTNKAYFYHFDNLGSTVAITDEQGSVVGKYVYGPFGQLINSEGAEWNPFQYVGRYGVQDEENGLLFMRNRYYRPDIGRFINRDPIGFGGGLNLYAYVSNDPINASDPLGLGKEPYNPKKDYCGPGSWTVPMPEKINYACYCHDQCYGTPGATKPYCDVKLADEVGEAVGGPIGDAVFIGQWVHGKFANNYEDAQNQAIDEGY